MDQMFLLPNEYNPIVVNTDIEGTTTINNIEPIRLQKRKIVLGVILSIFTSFIFALACSWSKKLVRKFFFKSEILEKATHMWIENNDSTNTIAKLLRNKNNQLYFVNRKLKYFYERAMNSFKALEFDLTTKRQLLCKQGVQCPQQVRDEYGKCIIDIPKPNLIVYLVKELTAPFFILQYLSCFLWVLEGLAVLSLIMISVSLIFTTINFLLLQNSAQKLREMAKTLVKVLVYRGDQSINQQLHFISIDSQELVPGDIIAIENKMVLPCDCVLVQGDLLMNEASLTGESIPIPKVPIDDVEQKISFQTDKRNCLYEGTKVLIAKPQNQYVLAVVGRTGFSSFKGQIFRSVLYPKTQSFGFYSQGIKYLLCLCVCVMIVYFSLLPRLIHLEYNFWMIFYRFWDALTWIVPPALPIFVSMCQTYSLVRLRKKGVFGIDPTKSLVAGKIDTICFDKTGTLTTIGIDFYGYQLRHQNKFKKFINKTEILHKSNLEFKLFSTCHGTYEIDGELMGDSLDVELFQFTEFKIKQNPPKEIKSIVYNQNGIELHVLKLYEFESALQRMSVIVKDQNDYYVFVKGSPEKMLELSKPDTIPQDFKKNLDILTMKGLRILGFGFRKISKQLAEELIVGTREDCEKEIEFFGLLAMENKLKSDTADVIKTLSNAQLDLKVISGDNPLTTIQCARECGIINSEKPVLLVDYDDKQKQLSLDEITVLEENYDSENSKTEIYEAGLPIDEIIETKNHSQIMNKLIQHLLKAENVKRSVANQFTDNSQYAFAISGKAFDYFWNQMSNQEIKKNVKQSFAGFEEPIDQVEQLQIKGVDENEIHQKLFQEIIINAKIFARMRPEQKSMVVEKLQIHNRMVLMIGDGANDCAAIKQANVGVSFASSDAAFSAPYSSYDDSINCINKILLDGRCSLQNALEVFQFYVCVSVIKYTAAMIIMSYGQNFGDIQYIVINYIGSLPYLKSLSLSFPSNTLTIQKPNESMMAPSNAARLSFQIALASVGLLFNYSYWLAQDYDQEPGVKDGKYIKEGTLQTTLFKSLQIYFIMAIIAIYSSHPFKQKLITHNIMLCFIALSSTMTLLIFFTYQDWHYSVLSLLNTSEEFGYGYNVIQFIITFFIGILMVIGDEFLLKKLFTNKEKPLTKVKPY